MRLMLIFVLSLCTALHTSLFCQSNSVVCIDGGGSKTLLQVIDNQGKVLSLNWDGITTEKIEAAGSNVNDIGKDGVRTTLQSLFNDVQINNQNLSLILPDCKVIACFAGIGAPQSRAIVTSLLEEHGIRKENLTLLTDAEASLELITDTGAILIAGTGSVCMGKKDQTTFRVGGLGKIIGDEGSGYRIGLQAIKAGLEEEYGWGKPSSLTPALKVLCGVTDLKGLIRPINLGEMPATKIAVAAPIVFEKAFDENDSVAKLIINTAATDLRDLLDKMVTMANLSHCEIHLWGSVFKNKNTEQFIKKISSDLIRERNITIVNQAHHNVALLLAKRSLVNS